MKTKKIVKKVFKILLIVFSLLVVLFIGNKIWQQQTMDLKNPELESVQSISEFKLQSHVPGDILLIAKDTISFDDIVDNYFGNGRIWVFDNKGAVLETNVAYSNSFGACFRNIKNNIIKKDFDFSNSTIEPSFLKRDFLKELIDNTLLIEGVSAVELEADAFNAYDYIVVYGWSKYYGMSHKNSQIKEIDEYIKSNDKKVLLIGVNVDYVDYWYPKEKPLPVVTL